MFPLPQFKIIILLLSFLLHSIRAKQSGVYTFQKDIPHGSQCPQTVYIYENVESLLNASSIGFESGVNCTGNNLQFESGFFPAEFGTTDYLNAKTTGPLQCGNMTIEAGYTLMFIRFGKLTSSDEFPDDYFSGPPTIASPSPPLPEGVIASQSPIPSKPVFFFLPNVFYLISSDPCSWKWSSPIEEPALEPTLTPGFDDSSDENESEDADNTEENENGTSVSTCFPSTGTVRTIDGNQRKIKDIRIGDIVETGYGRYAPVFSWTHKQEVSYRRYTYVQVHTSRDKLLELTPSHYVYIFDRKHLIPAGEIRPGLRLISEDGSPLEVLNVTRKVFNGGLYNPHTLHGDIVVDGVLTSTYTTAVAPRSAHALLAPLRALYLIAKDTLSLVSMRMKN